MKESNLNTIIVKSINKVGWAHKISDPLGGTGIQNPFDGFGVLDNTPIYFESKLIKNGIYAFNFNRIENHQISNLNVIQEMLPDSKCLIIIGFYEPRKLFEVCLFSIDFIQQSINAGIKSFKKKQLESWREKGLFLPINYLTNKDGKRKQYIDFNMLKHFKDYIIDGRKN